jgi:hypothetical protein
MPFSTFFANPVVEILEERLWETARKRYLGEHSSELKVDDKTVMRKVKSAYKEAVAAAIKEADAKVRARWEEFKHAMTGELEAALATVLQMSNVEWYAVEAGALPHPDVIAVPYQLLKRMTAEVMPQFLRKKIDFENLDDVTLEALAIYAANQKFQEVLEHARRNYKPLEIGDRSTHFVVAEVIKRDAYFLGEEKHHSLVDMVILSSTSRGLSDNEKKNQKAAVKKWFNEERKNRKDHRRFTGDGWEIEFEELKSFAIER